MVFKLFAILQKYDFSSKSQPIFVFPYFERMLFAILQKYDFSSKSQPSCNHSITRAGCLRYCKSTIFQANHNVLWKKYRKLRVVCDTAKVRFFKQITTHYLVYFDFDGCLRYCKSTIFQANHNARNVGKASRTVVCDTAKVRFFKQITTVSVSEGRDGQLFAILQKYDFSSKSQPDTTIGAMKLSCLRYCKSTIFQANHNSL